MLAESKEQVSVKGLSMARNLDLIELQPGEALQAEQKTVGWFRQHLNFLRAQQGLWFRYPWFGLVRLIAQRNIRVYEPSGIDGRVHLYSDPLCWPGLFLHNSQDKQLVLFFHRADKERCFTNKGDMDHTSHYNHFDVLIANSEVTKKRKTTAL